MSIIATLLTSGKNDSAFNPSTNTATVTPTANKLQLLFVRAARTASDVQTIDSITGCNISWQNPITSKLFNPIASPSNRRIFLFYGLPSAPTTGAVTITTSAPGYLGAAWAWVECMAVDVSNPPTSGLVPSHIEVNAADASSSPLVVIGQRFSVNNAIVAAFSKADTTDDFTPGTRYSVIANVDSTHGRLYVEYKIGLNVVPPSEEQADGTFGSTYNWGGIGVEVATGTFPNQSLSNNWVE